MSAIPPPLEVFYSFADADEPLRNELEKHLSLLKHESLITTWHKRQILAGTDWTEALDRHLNTASVILLLISPDFLASDYCYGTEMQRALQRHEAGEARVIPILLRPVDWQDAPFGKLQPLPDNRKPIAEWRNRDAAFLNVAKGIRAALEEVQHLTVNASPIALPRVWNIPYPRNPVFTGREEVLTRLADALKTGQPAALSQPQAISGLGGIGKTQIAVEYAYRFHQNYQSVLWTRADTGEALISGYVAMAGLLNLPEKNEQDQTITVQAVLRWLRSHTGWLLILDNADDLALLREFLPPVFGGHILLTTRAQAMGRLGQRIEVDTMKLDIGALFLSRRAGLVAHNAVLEEALLSAITTAKEVTEELGGLPLALDQAGAYIEETQCSLSQYLQRYRAQRSVLLQRRGGLVPDHPEPVATTWSLSFEKVEQASPAAADLLRLCAFLYPDAIPEEIITKGAAYLGPRLAPVTEDPLLLDEGIAALGAYSLIRRDVRDNTLSVHRLVQAVLKDILNGAMQSDWAQRTIQAVNAAFPEVEFTTWQQCERCLPHAQACADLIVRGNITIPEAANLLTYMGWYLAERGQYAEAELPLQHAMTIRRQQGDSEDLNTALTANSLGWLYNHQGKYEQAEPLYVRALAIRERLLGPEHLATASSLNNLASLYQNQGRYEQAEPLYVRVLAIREQQLGPIHPDMAMSLNNLAELYRIQGKYEQAEPLYVRALGIREQQLGPTHPDTAISLNNLASLYESQGKYEQAEPLLQQALAINEQQLGPTHPDTAISLNRLALLYFRRGRDKEAEPLFQRTLAIREQTLKPEHPDTVLSSYWLAIVYQQQQRYEEAEPLYMRVLAIRERILGSHHPQTSAVRRRFASLLRAMGREVEALQEETRDHGTTPPS